MPPSATNIYLHLLIVWQAGRQACHHLTRSRSCWGGGHARISTLSRCDEFNAIKHLDSTPHAATFYHCIDDKISMASLTYTTTVAAAGADDHENRLLLRPSLPPQPEPDNEAAVALVAISTLGRDVGIEEIEKLVSVVIQSDECRQHLVPLIMHLRNHSKSVFGKSADGKAGAGEKIVAERLLIALYHVDPPSAIATVGLMSSYGSYKSLANLLALTDVLNGETEAHDYQPLQEVIYEIFSVQLKRDLVEAAHGRAVSNASKYAPHENRGKKGRAGSRGKHHDEIAKRVLDVKDHQIASDSGKAWLRTRYRKDVLTPLNIANGHIAEIHLSSGQVDELKVEKICAGTLSKKRKAFLNLDKDGGERYDSEPRRALRQRILDATKANPEKLAAPTDLATFADQLMGMEAASTDAGEKELLEALYGQLVAKLKLTFRKKASKAEALVSALNSDDISNPEEHKDLLAELQSKLGPNLGKLIVAIDCTISQSRTHTVSALMALLLADVERALKHEGGDESAPGEEIHLVLFSNTAISVVIPSMETGSAGHRLQQLVELARARPRSMDGAFGAAPGNAASTSSFGAALELIDRIDKDRDIVFCSDFSKQEDFAAAISEWQNVEGNDKRTLSCWRLLKQQRKRSRVPNFNVENPRLDLCIVFDTTGSMGRWINHAQNQIVGLLNTLSENTGMPVRASVVSYKDFGDDRHLEIHEWVSTQDPAALQRLRDFIASLEASGGADEPEDVAGGLEAAERLLRDSDGALKTVLLIADAPAHGFYEGDYMTDDHVVHAGVNQRERTLAALKRLCIVGEAEIMFAECGGGHNDDMVQSFDSVLASAGTFVDRFAVSNTNAAVFGEKIQTCLESFVAHALVPPSTLGVDLFAGADVGIPGEIACARFADALAKLTSNKEHTETPSAYDLLVAKLDSEVYDLVRTSLDATATGYFSSYRFNSPLSDKAIDALIQSGLQLRDIQSAGYPRAICDQFEFRVKRLLAQR